MSRVLNLADRGVLPALRVIVAAHLLLLATFVALVAFASGRARAEESCSGHDMLASLQQSDPALAAKIAAEAEATPNGHGLLWKIEKPGGATSYLFGTMHMTDPRVTALPPAAQQAFEGAATVVIETTEVLDPAQMLASLAANPELTMFTDATTLDSLLTPSERDIVDAALVARGIPPGSVAKMKPWMISSMLALPACEMERKADGAPVLDVKLAQDAKAAGKPVKGLETVADQLGAMASLPMQLHIKGLVDTLKLGDRMNDVTETMIVLYTKGETGMFWPLFRTLLPDGGDAESGYAAFEQTMVTARNKVMEAHAEPILAEGSAFIAVGALHLPGPEGLIELFRQHGYTVTAVD